MCSKANTQNNKPTSIMVLFGATGDLASRKIIPALYTLFEANALPADFRLIAFARKEQTAAIFCQKLAEKIVKFLPSFDKQVWSNFSSCIDYWQSEFDDDSRYQALDLFLKQIQLKYNPINQVLFYLATPPEYFPLIIEKLSINNLLKNDDGSLLNNVMIEKPFGKDLESALELRTHLDKHLQPEQVYLIDHYLGKETVQGIPSLRFSNTLFESFWNKNFIQSVQIIISEKESIGSRGNFFDKSGTLKDIIQNHLLQLLTMVAIEPPLSFTAEDLRKEKIKIMQSLRKADGPSPSLFFRGQYAGGTSPDGTHINSYQEEDFVMAQSSTETFVAIKTFIDNHRWDGVPFYLTSGKGLAERFAEIRIFFKEPSKSAQTFYEKKNYTQECLVINLQPEESLSFSFQSKAPGLTDHCNNVTAKCNFRDFFEKTVFDAYARLIRDALYEDKHLFVDMEEVMTAWNWLNPIIKKWKQSSKDLFLYPSGSKYEDLLSKLF
ncbi:Glucose-6-phosphate 1-dehydrogenase [Candidatus Clavichlamydia salmonicola]|uniref:glucose-6-phosphate dehydrogenase n=1 Tax=Candidatus Clavichlamydia salmonicola TaxID=469812 RepID=UPI001890FD81|nr:glucose-6-phosphate dehydrogenase [Candidatus Clavichlamydia salmonicola]MBF5050830.1 Glucose-6-phosphate 1-dehydrogenase [Candidatus Clavichlamydia salmonicola]